jgi:glycosyltransferase involved in cell wall biosynthesis
VKYYKRDTSFAKQLSITPFIVNSRRSEALVKDLLKDDYPILCEGLHTTAVLLDKRLKDRKIYVRAHNVEHRIWRQLSAGERNPLRKWYLKHLALTLEVYEREHINDYDGIVCITDDDADAYCQMGCRRPMCSVPFAVEPYSLPTDLTVQPFTLFHIGSMDWKPNIEAIDWFLDKVWPLLHREVPQARLFLAGRRMPQRLIDSRIEGVTVVGEVDDAMRFMSDKSVNVVPLLSGSGIRVKILEAMSMGKTVISTTIGAQGIGCTDGKEVLIADTPEQFATQIQRCVDDPAFCRQIGHNAYNFITEAYSPETLTRRLLDFYEKRLNLQ